MTKDLPATDQGLSRVDKFLANAIKKAPIARGNLVFALDATMSPAADLGYGHASTGQMFNEVAASARSMSRQSISVAPSMSTRNARRRMAIRPDPSSPSS